MILEGFEIQDWSCIRKLTVTGLPATGVVVLHGPNGTGKSSIVEALRACVMDNKSTSRSLGRGTPEAKEKPVVSVTFRAEGNTWRVTKQFTSKESKLEVRTEAGGWKVESTDAGEVHDRTRQLAGGHDSDQGLHQLLWLTQAEFHLPSPKEFDAGVQSRLREVLGSLQTALDDRFISEVKRRWSRWFTVRQKPGEAPKLKKGCPLDAKKEELKGRSEEWEAVETQYRTLEALVERSGELEVRVRDLKRQLAEKTKLRDELRAELDRCQARLDAHQKALERAAHAEKDVEDRKKAIAQRSEMEERARTAQENALRAREDAEKTARDLETALQSLQVKVKERDELNQSLRTYRDLLGRIAERKTLIETKGKLAKFKEKLAEAEVLGRTISGLKDENTNAPAPGQEVLRELVVNRQEASRLRAELDAAAITLSFEPGPDAPAPILTIDGRTESDGAGTDHRVRRTAEVRVPGWGRVRIVRGTDTRGLDQIEEELKGLERKWQETIAPFGVPPNESDALDFLRGRAAERAERVMRIDEASRELDRVAPEGVESLQAEIVAAENSLAAGSEVKDLPTELGPLERLESATKASVSESDDRLHAFEKEVLTLTLSIEGADAAGGKTPKAASVARTDLRAKEHQAKLDENTARVRAEHVDEELAASTPMVDLEAALREAERALQTAREDLRSTELTEDEAGLNERLRAATEGRDEVEKRLRDTEAERSRVEGAIGQHEGLHQRRAEATARVDALREQVAREELESRAVDRLYALFEECREKQLSGLMGPIHDRVVRWMRLLKIGDYQSIRFNDQFLPERLVSGDGARERSFEDESTGTIEQLALMVRLALGSLLSTPERPMVALLDDPLTHSDTVRLDRMRAVLKDAAAGRADQVPPSGPLQLLVFTCHPEWFAFDGATRIDLADSDVLVRRS